MRRWLQEPLLHFLLIGAGIFLLYNWHADDSPMQPTEIVFSEADVNRLINLWERKWQRLPNQQELQGLLEQQVREEVFYREAMAMGLDKDDMVVRRRLAQKMEFVSNDLASLVEPDDQQLQGYLDTHPQKFAIPGRISYSQVYLDLSQHGEQVQADFRNLLGQLSNATSDIDISMLGDPFMGGYHFDNETDFGVSRIFGESFAEQIFNLPVGVWIGPVESGYGIHLVRVNSRVDSRHPLLDDVRDKVRREWLAEQQRKTNDLLYAELRKRYRITIAAPASSKKLSQ